MKTSSRLRSMRRKISFTLMALILSFSLGFTAFAQEPVPLSSEKDPSSMNDASEDVGTIDNDENAAAGTDDSAPPGETDTPESDAGNNGSDKEAASDKNAPASDQEAIASLETSEEEAAELQSVNGGYKVYQETSTLIGTYDTLSGAFQKVNTDFPVTSTSSYTITVSGNDEDMGAPATLSVNTAVLLCSADNTAKTIKQGQGLTRHILFRNSGQLTIQNITLDGTAVGGGIDARYSGATLTLASGATIMNCYSGSANGGGIVAENATVNLNAGSVVSKNRSGQDIVTDLNIYGGGVYASGGTLTVASGALVTENVSTSRGGGIYSTAATSIYGAISNNVSYRNGGGIYFAQLGATPFTMDGASISGNVAYGYASTSQSSSYLATGGGGMMIALSNSTTDLYISNSTFSNNAAPSERNTAITGGVDYYTGYQDGGGLYVRNGNSNDTKLYLNSCTFSNNLAQRGGGVSFNCWGYFDGTDFTYNATENVRYPNLTRAGAIYLNGSRGNIGSVYNLSLSNGQVVGNSAYVAAGISWTNASRNNVYVDSTAFSNQTIDVYMYTWDVNDPYPQSTAENNAKVQYESHIINVTECTAPATNIYNNADIEFSGNRYFTFETNGGTFDAQELSDYMNVWYQSYYYNIIGQETTDTPYAPEDMTPYLDGFTAQNTNGSYVYPAPDPSKEGDVFLGWYDDDTYTTPMENPTQLLGHYTFYALWQSMYYPIHYDDGFESGSVSNMPLDGEAIGGSTYTISALTPENPGYDFVEWIASTEAEESVDGLAFQPGDSFTMPEAGVTLTAVWNAHAEHVVRYASGVADFSVTNMPVDDKHVLAGEVYEVSTIVPERTGYSFVGELAETDAPDTVVDDIDGKIFMPGDHFIMPDYDVTLTMVWQADAPGSGGTPSGSGSGGTPSGSGTSTPKNAPKTGDDIPWILFAGLAVLAGGTTALAVRKKTSSKKDEQKMN